MLQSIAPTNTPAVLTGTVQPMTGKTVWQRRPMDPILLLLVLLLYSTIKYRKQKKKKKIKKILKK